ncbi:MAG: bifunctional folylpolyglutamate synthase/dihydrofolate synthase, partial [Planctomycetia bacterium]
MKSPRDIASDYLMNRIDWERSKSIPYAERTFRLDRMHRLLGLLDNPQDSLEVVHVAGTKGKGSTTAMLAAIFHAAGLKTGAFTSPHLDRIEERFAIDGQPCPGETFAELIDQIRPAVDIVDSEMPGDGPTYFEIATAIALLYFAQSKVDVAVLEVGLGGR